LLQSDGLFLSFQKKIAEEPSYPKYETPERIVFYSASEFGTSSPVRSEIDAFSVKNIKVNIWACPLLRTEIQRGGGHFILCAQKRWH
jgi:hypothetical protein